MSTLPRSSNSRLASEPAVGRAADLPEAVRSLPTVGRGPSLYPDHLQAAEQVSNHPGLLDVDPVVVGALALRRHAAGEPTPVEPLYLRRPDALTLRERAAT